MATDEIPLNRTSLSESVFSDTVVSVDSDRPASHLPSIPDDTSYFLENEDGSEDENWIGTYQVDDVQQTVRSFGGMSVDTQDSVHYSNSPYPCGNIQFWNDGTDDAHNMSKKHFVCTPADVSTDEVCLFMARFWRMRSPKIVLSIICGIRHFKPWKKQKFKADFQKGIIKAANTTEMWIITSGVDGGIAKIIGDAIREEKSRRASNRSQSHNVPVTDDTKLPKLTAIGVIPKSRVSYSQCLEEEYSGPITIKNQGHKPGSDLYELNPDHTHFILVEEEGSDIGVLPRFRCELEKQFESQMGRPRLLKRYFSNDSSDECREDNVGQFRKNIPVVGLLVQGGPTCIEHVLSYLKDKKPVVVLKGSGGVADLLAYAYEELQERSDEDFEKNFLKPELIKRINKLFADEYREQGIARNNFRDKIMECVHYSMEGDQSFLTLVNVWSWDASLLNLDKYILKALLRSETQRLTQWREQLHKDLQLTLDWNRPDLALSEIFHRDDWTRIRVDKNLFEQALLRKDREQFVELFLEQGFQVHKYLNHKMLKLLFERAEDREFFVTVCLEGALGQRVLPDMPLSNDFLDSDLNHLVYKLCGIKNFVNPYELSMNSVGLYVLDPAVAERKAMNCLIIWAILLHRHSLAKVLWKRSDHPIAVALIGSYIYKELSKISMELYLRTEMVQNAKDFGEMALGVLDISFRDSSGQAYNMLSEPLPDFNNKSSIEIAHESGYLHFIAHPCCQKWLTRKLFGSLQVKELSWGVFRLPYWFKILASVFLLFPMYIWITFHPSPNHNKKHVDINDDLDEDDIVSDHSDHSNALPPSKSLIDREFPRKRHKKRSIIHSWRKKRDYRFPVWKQIYLLWSAPITKFWVTQVFYFLYLGIFCLAVLWPTCGNILLDIVVWLWTVMILTELIRRTYIKYQKYKAFSLFGHCVEIFLIMSFLALYLILRIIPNWVNFSDLVSAKVVLCSGLIYFFYRLIPVYFPISPTLGPMLVRMTRMVKYDFVAFIRMFLIFLISGGVTIQAVLYPNYPLGYDMLKRVLTRPLFGLFLTQIQDLDGDASCSHLYKNVTNAYCATNSFVFKSAKEPDPLIEPIATCPYSSIGGYVFVIQYLLICKLILTTILFAMFALTISKVDVEASEIWKFQRYGLIVDFEERLCLPPPLSIFNYLSMFLVFCYKKMRRCKICCVALCCCCSNLKRQMSDTGTKVIGIQKLKRSVDFNYWKKCANDLITSHELEQEKEELPRKQAEVINSLREDMQLQKKSMKRMSDRIVDLERSLQTSRIYLEDIKHKLDKTDVQGVSSVKGRPLHVAARQSPYPGTRKARFPVFDKYVPWEQAYDVYDAKTYTKPRDQFMDSVRSYVDEDMEELKRLKEQRSHLTEEDLQELPPLPPFKPVWNSVITFKQDGVTRIMDRRSWITLDSQPVRYKLDPSQLPQNPMGRTGVRGKGGMWRWGPNHHIEAVITRWRRKYTPDLQPTGYLYVEGKRVLEFIAVQKDDGGELTYGLPGGALHGVTTPYSTLCEAFIHSVFDDLDLDYKTELDQADMVQFFAQFASQSYGTKSSTNLHSPTPSCQSLHPFLTGSRTSLRTEPDNQGFSATLLYKGYFDDPRNTDNAWVEAEVWNFHYDMGDTFDLKIAEEGHVKWKEVSPYVRLFGNEGVIVQEAAKIHDAYY